MLEYYELTHRRFEDYSSDEDYYQEELEPPRAEAMMEVEVLEAEVKVGPSLGRVLGESGCSFCFKVKMILFSRGRINHYHHFLRVGNGIQTVQDMERRICRGRACISQIQIKYRSYEVCIYSASLYSDSRRSSLMCLVPKMKRPSMAR